MINENNKNSWCVNAFHGMSANNDGSTKMCCMIKKSFNNLSNKPINFYIGKKTIKENFNNIIAQSIRKNLESGVRDSACELCWQEEDANRKSKRLRDNDKYLNFLKYNEPYQGLSKFELNLGNTCNIKCRTCHPTISSQWMKEDYDLNYSQHVTFKKYSDNMKKFHQNYDEESPFWNDLIDNLETIKQFDFYGGEPFLSKKMWEVLKICVEKGYSKNIELHYNTNGTIWPDETALWKNFKSVNLSFSIDGIGAQFEYMRFLAKWDQVLENMEKSYLFKQQFGILNISWCVTLSILNIYYLPEILDEYYKNFKHFNLYLNLVHGPIHFNISKIHPKIKEHVLKKIQSIPVDYQNAWQQLPGIIGFIRNGNFEEKVWKDFLDVVKKHDDYRKQNFYQTFKEFGDLINDCILE